MKVLVGLSNGLRNENIPYQMFIVDVDKMETTKQRWEELNPATLNSCSNVRVNLGNYKSITQNPVEYLEAEFDVSKLVDTSVNNPEYQIINVYNDDAGNPILYRTVNASGEVAIHHISEFAYKKKFSIYGENIDELPTYVKTLPLKDAYEWWNKKDQVKVNRRMTRFVYDNFETDEDMPVQLLYHYLTGVKNFQLGYHTITNNYKEDVLEEKLHEYFLFKDTANIKLRESLPVKEDIVDEEIGYFGNKDPYPDKRKIGYYGAIMSLICDRKNYPAFDIYSRPDSEINYDRDGIEIIIDLTDGGMDVYNKYEEANCISKRWRLGENYDFFGISLPSLLPEKLDNLSKNFQEEKERVDYGHWSYNNTKDWFRAMALAVSTQYYTTELRMKLNEILKEYQTLLSTKLNDMIKKISAKDSLAIMKWSEENVAKVLDDISFVNSNNTVQESSITMDQMRNLFTFKRNSYDLPDWLQIYSNETIEDLGGVDYLKQFIKVRGERSAELFLSIWAEKLESDQRYAALGDKDGLLSGVPLVEQFEEPNDVE